MKRLFFTTLISIVSITLITILIVAFVLMYKYNAAEKQWRSEAYDDYITYIADQLTPEKINGIESSPSNLKLSFESFPDDRITGLFFRSSLTQASFAIGKTPRGFSITSPATLPQLEDDQDSAKPLIPVKEKEQTSITDTLFDITYDGSALAVQQTKDRMPLDFELPDNVYSNDIVGSVTFKINGSEFGTVYIITHTPRTYSYSGVVLNGSIRVLIWSIPFALIISLVLAWAVSYSNTKMVGSIRSSLQQLTIPEHDKLKLPKNSNPFIEQIFTSIQELDETLAENQRNRSEWLRTISHDLNTPVASLKITLEGIQDKVFSPDDPQVLKTLSDETSTLEKRIRSITDFSQLQTISHVDTEEIPTEFFIAEVKQMLNPEAASKIRIDCQIPSIKGNRALLERACYELLSNCLAADPQSSDTSWKISSDGSSCLMEFTNKGTIPPDIDFFEPWAKGDWSRTEGGCGMGLPITARIIRLHRGTAQIVQKTPDCVLAAISWPME